MLLTFNEDNSGRLVDWLEKLGLKDFLTHYPPSLLIEWGWLVPQYRVVFPTRFFNEWVDYPYMGWNPSPELTDFATLWDYVWWIDNTDENLWFLNPVLRTSENLGRLLDSFRYSVLDAKIPQPIINKKERKISPYLDYFYRWQGYALIDVIRAAESFPPVFRTPDAIVRAKEVMSAAEYLQTHSSKGPTEVLSACNKWGGLAETMTWLAHFRSFKEAVFHNVDHNELDQAKQRYKTGAVALAEHLGVTEKILAEVIREKLLVLADSWMTANRRKDDSSIWTQRAWPYLRDEIQLAITWLIIISGKPFTYFVDQWKKPCFGNLGWAALDEVLPYEFLEHDKKIATIGSYYLKNFNEIKKNQWALAEHKISNICKDFRKKNYPFSGFLAAFYELHENLSHRPLDEHGIDFRERRPLDHFAMLAIHAEGCLRRELDNLGRLESIDPRHQTLSRYIEELAQARDIPIQIINGFRTNKKLADLKYDRSDPIGRIQNFKCEFPEKERQLLQGFLCCLLARNYFAHHDFLDKELIRSPLAKFLLQGILLTVLILLQERRVES